MTRAVHPGAAMRLRGLAAVAGAFLLTMVGFGAIYSYAAFADDIARSFGASKASLSVVFGLSGASCFFVSAATGALADRFGARVIAAAGMLVIGLGFVVAAGARSLFEVYLGYGVLVGLGCGCAYVPALAAVQRSFVVRRGLASGVAVSGIGVGTALVPSAAEAFAALGDWRAVFSAVAGVAVATGLVGAALLPPAARAIARGRARDPLSGPPVRLLGRGFVLAYVGVMLVSLTAALPHAMIVSTAQAGGLDRPDALALLSLIGVGTIVGRFALGAMADAIGRRLVFLLCCGGMAASMLLWAGGSDRLTLQAFALGFGALQGGFVALLPAFAADVFGPRALGRMLGVLYTSRGVALLAGPPALATGAVVMAGHSAPLVAFALLGLLGTVLVAAAGGIAEPASHSAAGPREPVVPAADDAATARAARR